MMILVTYIVTGALAGFLAGLLGIGGGLIVVPVLVVSFTMQGFAPEIVMHRPGIDLVGIAVIQAFIAAVTAVAHFETTIHDAFGVGDRVVFRLSHIVEYTGDEITRVGVVPAAGKTVTWDAIAIFRFEGDTIAEEWVARDEVAMLLQLGAIAPPSA